MKAITYPFTILCLCITMLNCNTNTDQLTHTDDYNDYLELVQNEALLKAKENLQFWEKKLEKEPNQFPYLAKIAASHSKLFKVSGNVNHLKHAEAALILLNEKTNNSHAGYLRSLARNYISQHRFLEALDRLKAAEDDGENLNATNKMLFDVYLELGDKSMAMLYLDRIKDLSDFDYLIRLSKWSDHQGNLEAAIKYMEKATQIAEASNIKGMKAWTYTNVADFYGHAGKVDKAYQYYLKTLALDPYNAYAKKGIAWIVYSYEKNPKEAMRILNQVSKTYKTPDIYLLQAEIAAFMNNKDLEISYLALYDNLLKTNPYGDMYNSYNITLYADNKSQQQDALKLALKEVKNRPTAKSYELLAWAYYKKGDVKKALSIVKNKVEGHIFEPTALYHMAVIYKASNSPAKVEDLKTELQSASFELGPMMTMEIAGI